MVSSSYSGPSFIFRTLNGRASWVKFAKIDKLVNDLVRDPSNPLIIYGAAKDRFYKSVDGGKILLDMSGPRQPGWAMGRQIYIHSPGRASTAVDAFST